MFQNQRFVVFAVSLYKSALNGHPQEYEISNKIRYCWIIVESYLFRIQDLSKKNRSHFLGGGEGCVLMSSNFAE